ncbi:MAG: BamA/TamA family outer membrane protein [Candidatus Gastranaerophilaceae bacterium]|jgi:outer membrane protein insertion porin family
MNNKKYKKNIIILMLILAGILYPLSSVYAINDEEDAPEPSVEAQKIIPKALNELKNKKYDDAVLIKKIEIHGNNLLNPNIILNSMTSKEGQKFDRSQIKEDLKKIYETGYFTDKIKALPKVSPNGVTLQLQVEENVPISGFNITGNKVINSEEIAKIFNSQIHLPQNIAELNKSIKEVETLYAEKGYILARVKEIKDDPDGIINIKINEGLIDEVKISGNTRTKEFVIRRNLLVESGMTYNETALKQDLSRLYNTQSFSDVRRVITPSDKNPDKYCLTIEVDEKRTGSISLGGGLDTNTGLFGTVGFMDRNFRGLGQQLSVNFSSGSGILIDQGSVLNKADLQGEVRFVEPRFKQTLNSLEVSAFGHNFASFQVPLAIEKRFGTEVEIGRPIKRIPHLAGSVSVGVEHVNVKEGDSSGIAAVFNQANIPISERAGELVSTTLLSLGPTLTYDTRDSVINSRKGVYSSVSFKESLAFGGCDSFGAITASIKKFIPIGKKSTFIATGKVGSNLLGDMPDFASFRLGGSRSIRGFKEGDVGTGLGFMMASAEYRTPIPFIERLTQNGFVNNMRLATFLDAGTIYKNTLSDRLYNRPGSAVSAGLGLRIMIPGLGPLSLDYGYPLTGVGSNNKRQGRFTFFFGDL